MEISKLIISLMVSTVLAGGLAALIGFILAIVLKKHIAKYVAIACVIGVAFGVLTSGSAFLKDIGLVSEKSASAASGDFPRIKEIVLGVMDYEDYLTPEIHREFWTLIDRNRMSESEIQTMKDALTATNPYHKLFYTDLLASARTGKPVKTTERTEYENWMVTKNLITRASLDAYEAYFPKVAAGKPVTIRGEEIILTESIISNVLAQIDAKHARLQALYTRPAK
jgi:hypothetical protein